MLSFAEWLASTSASATVTDILWLIPTLQTIHIICLAILFSSIFAIALGVNGKLGGETSAPVLARRFIPWVKIAFVVLVITGVLLIVGEPPREIMNWASWVKFPLIVVALIATANFYRTVANADAESVAAKAKSGIKTLVVLWALVIIFGRLIAYGQLV